MSRIFPIYLYCCFVCLRIIYSQKDTTLDTVKSPVSCLSAFYADRCVLSIALHMNSNFVFQLAIFSVRRGIPLTHVTKGTSSLSMTVLISGTERSRGRFCVLFDEANNFQIYVFRKYILDYNFRTWLATQLPIIIRYGYIEQKSSLANSLTIISSKFEYTPFGFLLIFGFPRFIINIVIKRGEIGSHICKWT